jgi:hypothetical protein
MSNRIIVRQHDFDAMEVAICDLQLTIIRFTEHYKIHN